MELGPLTSDSRNKRVMVGLGALIVLGLAGMPFALLNDVKQPAVDPVQTASMLDAGEDVAVTAASARSVKTHTVDGGVRVAGPSEVLVRAAWGSSPGQLGRERRQEGNAEGPMALTAARNGDLVVLDRLADGVVAILDNDGRPMGELPLLGPSVKEGGAVTGLFVDGDDVYVAGARRAEPDWRCRWQDGRQAAGDSGTAFA